MSKVICSTGQAPLTVTQYGIMIGRGAGQATSNTVVNLADGQILIGATGAAPIAASITAGTGIGVTPGTNSITIAVTGSYQPLSSQLTTLAAKSNTGTGNIVLDTGPTIASPTLTTPVLGTPSSGTLTGCTGLPIASGVSGLGSGVATMLATPSSANFLAACTDETGTGSLVFATSPTLVTPLLGVPTSGTLTNCTGLPIVGGTTGTLSVGRGGTNTTSFISGSLIYASSTSTLASRVPTAFHTYCADSGATTHQPTMFVGRNRLINGDMQVWQRGTSISVAASTTTYTADRWQISTNANQACTVAQVSDASVGRATMLRLQRNSGQTGTGVIRLCQTMTISATIDESYLKSNDTNMKVSLSFKARKGTNYSATSSVLQTVVRYGTGASDISGINGAFTGAGIFGGAASSYTLGTTTTAFEANLVGISNVTQIAVEFNFTPTGTASTNDYVDISDVQLEYSYNATAFDRKPLEAILRECQAFYYKTFPQATAPAQASATYVGAPLYISQIASTTAGYALTHNLPVTMRAAPTVTFYNPTSSNAKWYNITGAADSGTAATLYVGANNISITNPQVVGDLAGQQMAVHFACDAELV